MEAAIEYSSEMDSWDEMKLAGEMEFWIAGSRLSKDGLKSLFNREDSFRYCTHFPCMSNGA